jgi:D-aminopeptidase
MRMTVCAGVIALAALSLSSIVPSARAADMMDGAASAHTASIDVARIKSALHLTAAQEPYWAPVEAALRELARRQERDANDGLVRRVSKRVVQVALNSATVHRLAAAARPLVKTFDEQQMRTAHGLAQEMGFGPVVAALK